jgi:antitoxin (DNA-binding transcriptional repressor) of toxin-antitoxin stability system
MKERTISVTEASRNFADCVNRAFYQGVTFNLEKNGVAMARIVPAEKKSTTGRELAAALHESLKDFHLGEEEATAWLHELEETRRTLPRPVTKWQS